MHVEYILLLSSRRVLTQIGATESYGSTCIHELYDQSTIRRDESRLLYACTSTPRLQSFPYPPAADNPLANPSIAVLLFWCGCYALRCEISYQVDHERGDCLNNVWAPRVEARERVQRLRPNPGRSWDRFRCGTCLSSRSFCRLSGLCRLRGVPSFLLTPYAQTWPCASDVAKQCRSSCVLKEHHLSSRDWGGEGRGIPLRQRAPSLGVGQICGSVPLQADFRMQRAVFSESPPTSPYNKH